MHTSHPTVGKRPGRALRSGRAGATVAAILASAGLLAACATDADQAAPQEAPETPDTDTATSFYEGRQIEWLTPFEPGGGNDIQARYFTPMLSDAIPGNPSIQVTNFGGAGGVIGTNLFATSRDPDGETVVWTTGSTNISWMLNDEGVDFDYNDFTPIFAVPSGLVAYVAADTGITDVVDLSDTDAELIFGSQTPSGSGATLLMAWDLLGADVRSVFGYAGGGEIQLAFEQGEINLANASTAVYVDTVAGFVERGDAVPLFSIGQLDENGELTRDPVWPDLPHVGEAYELIHGSPPSGELWDAYVATVAAQNTFQKIAWVHAAAPAEAAAAIRDAMTEVVEANAGTDEWLDIMGPYDVIHQGVEEAVGDGLINIPPSVGEWILNWLDENFADQ